MRDGDAEDGDTAAVRADGYLRLRDAGELRDSAQNRLLDWAGGVVVSLGRGAEVAREGEHPRMLARAVVAQQAGALALTPQALGRRAVEGVVDAALQETLVETDLFKHPGDDARVQVFPAVRAAGNGQLGLGQTEAVGRAARDERDGLKRLGR